jgi:hypothetical protein
MDDLKFKALLASRQFKQLLAAGVSLHDLRAAGFSLSDLRDAGASLHDLRAAGVSLHDLLAAGVSLHDLRAAGAGWIDLLAAGASLRNLHTIGASPLNLEDLESSIPLVENPYTRILADIRAGQRLHDQSTFGPDCDPATNLCGSAMCTGGHLVNLGGAAGYALKDKYGWLTAAALIHEKAHPGWPCQDFGMIPQENALAYIEYMAACESSGIVPFAEVEK